ncbi:unnamed protein product [Auanema sp. JU1783]|nr:unnamed protein product [Auanema sp. JU1783]
MFGIIYITLFCLKMSLGATFYNAVGRRFSTLFLATAFGAYIANYTFNTATDGYWNTVNAGKQWKDVKNTITVESE